MKHYDKTIQVGNTVECIDNSEWAHSITKNGLYEVLAITPYMSDDGCPYYTVRELATGNTRKGFNAWRFKKVEPMAAFKVGDKVILKKNQPVYTGGNGSLLEIGKVYTVDGIHPDNGYLYLEEFPGHTLIFATTRFELADETVDPVFTSVTVNMDGGSIVKVTAQGAELMLSPYLTQKIKSIQKSLKGKLNV